LAKEIVAIYYSREIGQQEQENFNKMFRDKEIPDEIKEVEVLEEKINILELLLKTGLVESKQEARRAIEQKGIKIDNIVKEDINEEIVVKSGTIIQKGKRFFAKIK
jgi:tyrosyl-tRNA synthetase